MGAMKRLAACLVLGILALPQLTGKAADPRQAVSTRDGTGPTGPLFAQSAVRVLNREFASGDVSFLLLDARTGALLTSHWDDPERPIPLGSLVKPFTALAYAQEHDFIYPVHLCRGAASGCWLAKGHGRVDITSAIAKSCNSYFLMLTANMSGEQMRPTARAFGLEEPDADLSGAALMGLGDRWLISPQHMARAYLELYRRRDQPGVRNLVAGMAQSTWNGTGMGVGRALKDSGALVKTGTASCTHPHRAPGDGFVIALVPADQPELLLMVRVHGVPGAKASVTAGKMLRRMRQ